MNPLPILAALALPQGPGDLEAVRQVQARRTAIVAKVQPSVCAVMAMNSPGGGSGVIFDPAGYVLSNFHVVQARRKRPNPRLKGQEPKKKPKFDPANKIMKIGLPDGRLYKAVVLGIDPGSDLAILKIEPKEGEEDKPFPYSPLGDSDALLVGETVFAMGNPFLLATDFTPTLTWGIVSGVHRYQAGQGNRMLVYPDCIQVDAPVNPGNSGGPLFNEHGEVVGINGRINVRDRGRVNTGTGFAIAANQIRNFLADMMAGKHAEHGTLDLNAWYMKSPGETKPEVIVQSTFNDAEAARLGLGLGDLLTHFNGTPLKTANQLATLVGVLPSDSWVSLGFRPHKEGGGFGDEKTITFKMRKLDTGSTKYETPRIATVEQRKAAAKAMTRQVGAGQESVEGASLVFAGPDGSKIKLARHGEKLYWSNGEVTLVRTDAEAGFRIVGGKVSDASADDLAKLDREFSLNPWLWRGPGLRERIADGQLEGGIQVLGRPAYRIRVPGKTQREIYFYEDGSPAGYRLRDRFAPGGEPALVDIMVSDGELWWVVNHKTLIKGWKLEKLSYDPLPDAALFVRPVQ